MPPPHPVEQTLKAKQPESLLDVIRASARRAETDTATPAAIQERAKVCQREALVVQDEDGLVYYVRNAPPPGQLIILGKSGIIDPLAAPPPVHVVRFENFSQSTVEDIARSTALITAGPRDGVFERALDGLTNFFNGTERGGRMTNVTIERAGEAEVLSLSEEPGSIALLKDPVSWHSSTIEEATATRWTETFGEDAKLAPSSDALIVRFGGKPGTASGWLGIRVEMEPSRRTGIVAKLRAIVGQWIGSQPIKPLPWADSVVDLRAAIRRQLEPADLDFYYQKNKAKIRVAAMGRPNEGLGAIARRSESN